MSAFLFGVGWLALVAGVLPCVAGHFLGGAE